MTVRAFAPGRVNLIGEHTDCGGLASPAALGLAPALARAPPRSLAHASRRVKRMDDLLAVRSDVYAAGGDGRVEPRGRVPCVELDPEHFGTIASYRERSPEAAPSLRACERSVVRGDVTFDRGVVARGRVELADGPARVADGTVLDGR